MKNNCKYVVLGILFIISAYYFYYKYYGRVNYSIFYKSLVEQTVRDMVKEEAFKK